VPVLFYKDKPNRFFFEVPEKVEESHWKALVVFGDKNEAQVITYPSTASAFRLDYPEKKIVEDRSRKRIARKPDMDPLIEHIVKTENPQMPQITLFLRPPKGISNPTEVQGVMAICILGDLAGIKRDLQLEDMPGDYRGLFSFANKHKLAILAWGSRRLWNPRLSYDELAKAQAKDIDKSFDVVAEAWERGVKELCEKYGFPNRNFLIWGLSGSAQWAARLCLRKPDYFLAIHVHVPSSFDKATPEAAKVLWCLTTGELESGYGRSKRFVAECHRLGYPMVYKAIVGLGHAAHPDASELGFKFFEFALTQRKIRAEYDKQQSNRIETVQQNGKEKPPWPEIFQHPPYYGDMINQEIFPADQVGMIPKSFRIALPTKEIAAIWSRDE